MVYFKILLLLLVVFAVFDLIVGVSNDAVNFLNSSLGSGVASRRLIFIVASLGILAGVIFSSGMMEVARKGIFNPSYFTMPQLLNLFVAVVFTDVILLDIFNAVGLPTSTTVSVVFELLGAATAASIIKIFEMNQDISMIANYLNTARAMLIIFGILLSIAISFIAGTIVQFITRLIFTFDYTERLRRYGAVWGGVAIASICYFILVKGAKDANIITPQMLLWIKTHTVMITLCTWVVSGICLQIMLIAGMNILKPIILIGTFALAMAFAANDLVNFIGVTVAGFHTYKIAMSTAEPLNSYMTALAGQTPTETSVLILSGMIMVITIWVSKKARSVTETEIGLASQDEVQEKFESTSIARVIVRLSLLIFNIVKVIVPSRFSAFLSKRIDPERYIRSKGGEEVVSFDLLRAAVNLVVASALISYATSKKLPLSTTYVTFMVAMGTSFADRAWGRDSAVYRITGVLTVIGGWFMTALLAFSISLVFAFFLYYTKWWGLIVLLSLTALAIRKTNQLFTEKDKEKLIFNLKKVSDPKKTVKMTFEQMSILLKETRNSVEIVMDGLFKEDIGMLTRKKNKTKILQQWTNIIVANVFKAIRLLQRRGMSVSDKYPITVHRLQKIADAERDMVMRVYNHVINQHKGLIPDQIKDIERVKSSLDDIFIDIENMFKNFHFDKIDNVKEKYDKLIKLSEELNAKQFDRIIDHSSKTRLTILYYSIIEDVITLAYQSLRLTELFRDTFFHSLF